jgi:hypothetical protein
LVLLRALSLRFTDSIPAKTWVLISASFFAIAYFEWRGPELLIFFLRYLGAMQDVEKASTFPQREVMARYDKSSSQETATYR